MAQVDKVFLNLAGEFAVASELNRRQVLASVTYGASKSADIFAVNGDMTRIVRVEVKATDKHKWPIGQKVARAATFSPDVLWVLVRFPEPLQTAAKDDAHHGAHAPRYFILTPQEIHEVWRKEAEPYQRRYLAKHGHAIESIGVPNVTLDGVLAFEGHWEKITSRVGGPQAERKAAPGRTSGAP